MKLVFIVSVLTLTAFTFFAATLSINAMTTEFEAAIVAKVPPSNQADVESLQEEYDIQQANFVARIADLEAEIQDLRESKLANATDLDAIKGQLQSALVANDELKNQLAQIPEASSDDAQQFAAVQEENSALKLTIQDGQLRIDDLEGALAEANLAVERSSKQINDIEVSAAVKAAQLNQLETDLAAKSAEMVEANDRITSLLDELTKQSANFEQTQVQVAGLNSQIAAFQADIVDLKDAVAERDATIEHISATAVFPQVHTVATCSEEITAILGEEKIVFENGTNVVDQSSFQILESLAATALDCAKSDLSVTIGGHTDSQGGEVSNQRLSEARAESVRSFFAVRGLPASAMDVVGYGESDPIADNSTSEGRSLNRRITFVWAEG